MYQMTFTSTAALNRIERIQQLLRHEPSTIQEIADAVFISLRYATDYIRHLREHGQVYICEYRRDDCKVNRVFRPLYAWGTGTDAPSPDRSSRARQAEYRARIRADPEKWQRELARRKARRLKPRRDWTAEWIPTRSAA